MGELLDSGGHRGPFAFDWRWNQRRDPRAQLVELAGDGHHLHHRGLPGGQNHGQQQQPRQCRRGRPRRGLALAGCRRRAGGRLLTRTGLVLFSRRTAPGRGSVGGVHVLRGRLADLYPNDKLAIVTRDGGRGQVVLVVNELNEQEAVTWGAHHEPYVMPTRFRIIRENGAAFAPNLGNVWQPTFTYDPNTGLLTANDNGTGIIPSTSLCLYPRWQGCYVTIRYAGHNNNGKFHLVDNVTRRSWVAESGMTDVKWSKVQFISHDDGIALEATAAVAGQPMVCDFEIALVHPGNRLCARYQGGL